MQPLTEEVIEQKSLTLYEQATALVVTDQDSYAAAGEVAKALKSLEKEIVDFFEPMRISTKAAYDAVNDKKKKELAPVVEAMGIVRQTMNDFIQEQDRIRKAAEAKARAEAEEQARKDRERLEKQAMAAMEKGKDEKAETLMEQAANVYAEPVAIAPTVDKTVKTAAGNITQAKELQITVVDLVAFLSEIVKRNMAPTMIDVKAGPLKAWVKANDVKAFPGLSIKETVGVRI